MLYSFLRLPATFWANTLKVMLPFDFILRFLSDSFSRSNLLPTDYKVDRGMTTIIFFLRCDSFSFTFTQVASTSLSHTDYKVDRDMTTIIFFFSQQEESVFVLLYCLWTMKLIEIWLHFDLLHHLNIFLLLYCVRSTNLLEALLQSSFSFTTRSYTLTSATTQVASYFSTAYGLWNRSRHDFYLLSLLQQEATLRPLPLLK